MLEIKVVSRLQQNVKMDNYCCWSCIWKAGRVWGQFFCISYHDSFPVLDKWNDKAKHVHLILKYTANLIVSLPVLLLHAHISVSECCASVW